MKKNVWAMILFVLLISAGLVYAQQAGGGAADQGMMGKGMMGKKMMMGSMHGMVMHDMMKKDVIATSDGGVIIVTMNKISKYDKDLNLVKEVDIKMDMEGMQKMMTDMMEKCPMMGKGMMGNADDAAETKADDAAPADEIDHASHH